MPILNQQYTTIRPSISGEIIHQGILLETRLILLDTGADKSQISWDFCKSHNLIPTSGLSETTKTLYGTGKSHFFNNIEIKLLGNNGTFWSLKFAEGLRSIENSKYDFPIVLGMDVLSMSNFILNGKSKEFVLITH